MMMNTEKLEALEDYLKVLRFCYKPIRTDDSFDRRRNNYIEYKSRGDRYENLSPKEYLKMIRQYLCDLISNHKPTTESTDRASNSNRTWRMENSASNAK